jgi:hypothetical protein
MTTFDDVTQLRGSVILENSGEKKTFSTEKGVQRNRATKIQSAFFILFCFLKRSGQKKRGRFR